MAYTLQSPTMGVPDLSTVITAGNIGTPGNGQLPSVTTEPQLGETVKGWDTTLGSGEFIFLAVPKNTAITAGLLYQFDKNYNVVVVPAGGTSKNTGVAVALAINTVSSNANSVQYTWFLIRGQASVLKAAVTVSPQTALYMSATAGRITNVSSAGKQILGARTQNTATVTSTTSTVTAYFNYSSLEGA